jgi:hypothetical protein
MNAVATLRLAFHDIVLMLVGAPVLRGVPAGLDFDHAQRATVSTISAFSHSAEVHRYDWAPSGGHS